MGSHAYLRFLARVAARQPRLRPPPDASLTPVSPAEYLALMPYTHPISGYRSRSFELRRLELRVAQESALASPSAAAAVDATQHSSNAAGRHAPGLVAGSAEGISRSPRSSSRGDTGLNDHSASSAPEPADASTATATVTTAPPSHPQQPCSQQQPRHTPQLKHSPQRGGCHEVSGTAAPGSPRSAAAAATTATTATTAAVSSHAANATCGSAAAPRARHAVPQASPDATPPGGPHVSLPSPPHSYMEVYYPFTSLPWLWREYHRAGFPGLDPALVIEDFDTFAADVAARHVGHVPDSMLVTAFLERLTWHLQLRPGDGLAPPGTATESGGGGGSGHGGNMHRLTPLAPVDLRLAGQVTWVGRSSMEVLLQLTTAEAEARPGTSTGAGPFPASGPQGDAPHPDASSSQQHSHPPPPPSPSHTRPSSAMPRVQPTQSHQIVLPPGQLVATAEFVMALRDSSLRRAVDVPPLHPRDALERELFLRGREHQRQRQARRDRDRDTASSGPTTAAAAAAVRPSSPARAAHSSAAVEPTAETADPAAALDAPPELARMLYDSLLRSDECRTVPTDLNALHLLDPGSDLEWEGVERPSDVGRRGRVKRQRLDGSPSGGGSGSAEHFASLVDEADLCLEQAHDRPRKQPQVAQGEGASTTLRGASPTTCHPPPVPIRQTEMHRTVVAEFQDRNTSGTVFGGHLLRLAYEHAATAAAAFAGAPCELLWLEEGAISAPARVGDVLHAVSRVVWAEQGGRALRVVVRLGKYDVSAPSQHVLALTLVAAFLAPAPLTSTGDRQGGCEQEGVPQSLGRHGSVEGMQSGECLRGAGGLRGVVPTTLTEAAEALAAQRRHDAALAALAAAETAGGAAVKCHH